MKHPFSNRSSLCAPSISVTKLCKTTHAFTTDFASGFVTFKSLWNILHLLRRMTKAHSTNLRALHNLYRMYVGLKTSFYAVRQLDSTASCLPTGHHLGFFLSCPRLIPSIQFFFGLPRAPFCFGIHFSCILGNLTSAILWTWPYNVSWFCSVSFIIGSSNPMCCLVFTILILSFLDILEDILREPIYSWIFFHATHKLPFIRSWYLICQTKCFVPYQNKQQFYVTTFLNCGLAAVHSNVHLLASCKNLSFGTQKNHSPCRMLLHLYIYKAIVWIDHGHKNYRKKHSLYGSQGISRLAHVSCPLIQYNSESELYSWLLH